MKKYIITLLIGLFFILVPSAKADIVKPEVTDHEVVKVNLFWASWCPHCHDFIEYFKDAYADYTDYFEIVTYQIDINGRTSTNTLNTALLSAVGKEIDETSGNIPLILIGEDYYKLGFGSDGTEIIEKALEEYQNAEYSDLVTRVAKENNLEVDAKEFIEACSVSGVKCKGMSTNKGEIVAIVIVFAVIILGFGGLVLFSRKK